MVRRRPLRVTKAFDEYVISFGSAGFAVITKNGKRVQPKNAKIVLRKRKEKL